MTDFARYQPRRSSFAERATPTLRRATPTDASGLAGVMAVRGGLAADRLGQARRLINKLPILWLAEVEAWPVGWGGAQPFEIHADEEPRWLVAGLTVVPELRRRGIAAKLLARVVAEVATIAPGEPVFSVVNAQNLASVDLHLRLGFVEVERAATLARIQFTGGEGVLLRHP